MEKLISAFYKRGRWTNKSRRMFAIIIGLLVLRINNYLIIPWVVINFDYPESLIISNATLILISYGLIKLYDNQENDVLFMESLKRQQSRNLESKFKNSVVKSLIRFSKYGSFLLTIVVLFMGPLITVVYFREGYALYNSIPNKKIALLFLLSSILCSASWVATLKGAFSLLELINIF